MLDIYINKSLWLKICLVGLCILMFISCQSDETAVQNDLAAKQTINRVSEILPTGSKISNEDFTKLKAIYEKYPDSETVFQTYKSDLIVRKDWATLE